MALCKESDSSSGDGSAEGGKAVRPTVTARKAVSYWDRPGLTLPALSVLQV